MGKLSDGEVYRCIKPVDLTSVLPALSALQFVSVNQGGTDTSRYPCDVVLADKFPPALKAALAEINLGGELARAILRRLSPRQNIPPHTDAWMPAESDWRRFQLPLTSHPRIVMRWPDDGIEAHLCPGFLYEVRFDRLHEVVNNADCERIHLQIDQVGATI